VTSLAAGDLGIRFATDGFITIERAFPRELADQAREILWKDTGCDPHDKSTWTKPVVRLGMYSQQPFIQAPARAWERFPSDFPVFNPRAIPVGTSTRASAMKTQTFCHGV
jgi:hypothetical protein